VISIITGLIGFLLGYFYKDMKNKIDSLTQQIKKKEPEIGATNAAYGRVDPFRVNQDGDVGLVEPKTAQRLEWEEQERLRKMQII
jgi:hypothetical protein